MPLRLAVAVVFATCLLGCNLFRAEDYEPAPDVGFSSDASMDPDVFVADMNQPDDCEGAGCDVDECAEGTDDCHPLVNCTNLDPLYECGACPAGYDDPDGDGRACNDVDECTDGTHDCHADATCTNEPGTFTCACDPPFVGDGRTCAPPTPGLVAGVHHVTVNLTTTSGSAQLPAGIGDASKVVPFATAMPSDTMDNLMATVVDVWVDVQAGTVEVERGNGTGSVEVHIALVEFDQANVQAGTFEMDGDTTEHDVALPSAFDPTKSFVVFGAQITGLTLTDYNQAMAALDYDGVTLGFSRRIGFGSTVGGHWYAVEAAGDEFAVATDQMEIAFGDRCVSTASSADFSRTMLIAVGGSPASQNGPLENASMANIACGPAGGMIECCRGAPDPGTNAVAITVFSVEFDAASNGSVEYQLATIPIGDTETERTLATALDPTWAMASFGRTGMIGAMKADEDLPAATMNAAFGAASSIQNGAAVRAEIATATTAEIEAWIQAVSWPH